MQCVSTLWGEMSVVLFIGAEYVHNVHDELEQLRVETLLLPQRCAIRGKLWEVSSLWWLKKEIDEQFNVRWFYCLLCLMGRKSFYLSSFGVAGDVCVRVYYLTVSTTVEICGSWPIGIFPLLVANDSISSSLALPHLVTKQIVAPSGGNIVLQYYDACGILSWLDGKAFWPLCRFVPCTLCQQIEFESSGNNILQ